MGNIDRDINLGGSAEALVCGLFERCGLKNDIMSPRDANRAWWDICTCGRGLHFTTEVKFDVYERKSGNIALEVANPKKKMPSGLGITKAVFWAHVLVDDVVWLTTVKQLRQYVADTKPHKHIKVGGDKNAELYLYKSSIILPAIFHRVDNILPEQLFKYLEEHADE